MHPSPDESSLTDEERLQREARYRAHRQMEFLRHLAVFIPVMLLILAIDVLAGDEWFIHWVAGIWGGILAIHFLFAFVLDDLLGPAMHQRMTENQLRRLEERSRRG
ncbi:MAG: 2TM domain-containing protein [bacterium]